MLLILVSENEEKFSDVKNFCERCEKCLANKPKPKLTQTSMIEKRDLAPGQCIAIDIVGKLPRSTENKNYILTIIDHYSRFLEAYPLQNIITKSIINCLNKYFSNFGIPKILISDNGSNFVSKEMEGFFKLLNIEHRKTSVYFPQSNGLLERAHRTMKESLASICGETFQWSEKLLFFKLYYNNSVHSVTKYAPAEIFFGRSLNLPIDSFFKPSLVEDQSGYLKQLKENFKIMRTKFAENEQNYFKNNMQYIKGRTIPKFELDDEVFVREFSQPHVLQPKYKGPFKIIKILRNNNYILKKDDEEKTIKLNVSKLFLKPKPNINLQVS